jgi:hypothetical protein
MQSWEGSKNCLIFCAFFLVIPPGGDFEGYIPKYPELFYNLVRESCLF